MISSIASNFILKHSFTFTDDNEELNPDSIELNHVEFLLIKKKLF